MEGGGAKGAFHCGAVKALYDNGYVFDGIAGTSIGAVNAAMIAQDNGYQTCLDMWLHLTAGEFTELDDAEVDKFINKNISLASVSYWVKKVFQTIKTRGIPTNKVMTLLKKYISEEKLRNSSVDFALVTYSLSGRTPVKLFLKDIPKGELHEFIMASAYYPAFKLDRINGQYYVDGGICDNMPIGFMADNGYNEIIAIRTMSRMPYSLPSDDSVKVSYIRPSAPIGKTAYVSQRLIRRNIKLGYYDALRFIKGYLGHDYYIGGNITKLTRYLRSLPAENIEKAAKIFDLPKDASVENVICKADDFLKKSYKLPDENPLDGILTLLEEYAKIFETEKFKIYDTTDEFIDEIRNKVRVHALTAKDANKKTLLTETVKKDKLFCILINRESR